MKIQHNAMFSGLLTGTVFSYGFWPMSGKSALTRKTKCFALGRASLMAVGLLVCCSTSAQITITGYNHVALSVKDINASAQFYREVVGLEPIEVPENLKAIRAWFKIAPGQELHLLAGRTDLVANNDRNGAHFALSIPDANPVEKYLIEKSFPYHRQQRFDGAWQIYITDPDGYVIELNEPKVR